MSRIRCIALLGVYLAWDILRLVPSRLEAEDVQCRLAEGMLKGLRQREHDVSEGVSLWPGEPGSLIFGINWECRPLLHEYLFPAHTTINPF